MHDMGSRPRHGLSLCAGGGGLDMGLQLAEPQFETRCHVEWEAYPQRAIIAAQHAGYFAPAPIWDDVTTFDGRPWRGHIDTVLAGYPCQPFSQAGQRKGSADERHLWPDVARIIREVDPTWVFLENVAGHVSLGLDTVLGDLGGMDLTPAVGLYTSKEAIGSHDRLRMFIVAHANGRNTCPEREQCCREQRLHPQCGSSCGSDVVDTGCSEWRPGDAEGCVDDRDKAGWIESTGRASESGGALVNTAQQLSNGNGSGEPRWQPDNPDTGPAMGNTVGERLRSESGAVQFEVNGIGSARIATAGTDPRVPGPNVGDAGGFRNSARSTGQAGRHEGFSTVVIDTSRPWISPPGPADTEAWQAVLAQTMELAPAIGPSDLWHFADYAAQMAQTGQLDQAQVESTVRRMADALAERPRALRLLGNGVDPLAAANAWRHLALAHGLIPLDLEASGADEPVLIAAE